MPGKTLKVRIQNKIDSLEKFQQENPYILSGEMLTAYQTIEAQTSSGKVLKRVASIYVGPGYFNDLVPIVGPSSDVHLWAKVENFVDVVIANLAADDTKEGKILEGDTVNDMINRINNNYDNFIEQLNNIPTKTSQLINDGEGADAEIKDFLTGYTGYEYVTRDSVKAYIEQFGLQDIEQLKEQVKNLQDALNKAIEDINGKFENYYTSDEIDTILADYLKSFRIGDIDGGEIISPASTYISSQKLWNQVKATAKPDMETIAGAAASTALEQANKYTDNKLAEFITITYKGPYNSYADLVTANPSGRAGVIYLVRHDHNASDSHDSTDSDIFDEYIWIQNDDVTGTYEKVGNTDVKLTDYLQAIIKEDNPGVIEGDEKSVSRVEIVEDPIGSGNKVFKVTYKTLVKSETFTPGYVAIGFGDGALKSTALVNLPLSGLALSSTSSIDDKTTLGTAIRTSENLITEAAAAGVQRVDIETEGGLDVRSEPLTDDGVAKIVASHSLRSTASTAIASTVGSTDGRSYIKQIGLDKYGHIVSVESAKEEVTDSYTTSALFSTAKNKVDITIKGTGPNFQEFTASLTALPAYMLTQTDDEDDFLIFYCGDSIALTSTLYT